VRAAAGTLCPEVEVEAAKYFAGLLDKELARGRRVESNASGQVLDACTQALGALRSAEGVEYLVKKAGSSGDGRTRFYVTTALGSIPGGQSLQGLIGLVYPSGAGFSKKKDKDGKERQKPQSEPLVAIAALQALAARGDPAALETFYKALVEPNFPWEAKLPALEGLKRLKDRVSVDRVIDALDTIPQGEGRLKAALIEFLQELTGLSSKAGTSAGWKGELAAKKSGAAGGGRTTTQVRETEFFGLKTKSTRLVFILDCSISMKEKASDFGSPPKEPPKPPQATGGRAVKNPDPFDPNRNMSAEEQKAFAEATEIYKKWMASSPTIRIDILRKQFIRTLYFLDHRVQFAVVWYAGGVSTWKDTMVYATWAQKVQAMRHAEQVGLASSTNLGDALLEYAFKFVAKPAKDGKYAGESGVATKSKRYKVVGGPDTFYLLTDGEPNAGKYAAPGISDLRALANATKKNITAELEKVLKMRKVVIHTICIGEGNNNAFDAVDPAWLRSIADMTGGSFQHVTARGR
jgi:hypothetical protein